jgi:hypothetical protein
VVAGGRTARRVPLVVCASELAVWAELDAYLQRQWRHVVCCSVACCTHKRMPSMLRRLYLLAPADSRKLNCEPPGVRDADGGSNHGTDSEIKPRRRG